MNYGSQARVNTPKNLQKYVGYDTCLWQAAHCHEMVAETKCTPPPPPPPPAVYVRKSTSWSDVLPGKLEGAAGPASQSQQTAWPEEGRDLWVEWQVWLPAGGQDVYQKLGWGTCPFFSSVKVVAVLHVCLCVPVRGQSFSWHRLCFLSATSQTALSSVTSSGVSFPQQSGTTILWERPYYWDLMSRITGSVIIYYKKSRCTCLENCLKYCGSKILLCVKTQLLQKQEGEAVTKTRRHISDLEILFMETWQIYLLIPILGPFLEKCFTLSKFCLNFPPPPPRILLGVLFL